jgi:hypothetical protein
MPVSKDADMVTVMETRNVTAVGEGENGPPRAVDNVTVCRDTFRQVEGKWLLVSPVVTTSEAKTNGKSAADNRP